MGFDRYRPCENPACRAIDSTHCAFRIGESGMVIPPQQEEAERSGCRVIRFKDAEMEEGPHESAD